MDPWLKLTAEENIVYNRELETIEPIEREVVMEWTNDWIEQGKAEERKALLIRQFSRRFGSESQNVVAQIERELSDALFDFHQISDVERWLAERPATV
jgi:hypothetical protein